MVAVTPDLAERLELDAELCQSESFARFFSGNVSAMSKESSTRDPRLRTWCTPYALSIGGHEMYDNCPYKNGNGYGDGRAISIAEILNSSGERWELQLKGAGTTPFSRGADGRAVLRSSVREFLASEAMHNLGVSTTRALSLIVSETGFIERPWFTEGRRQLTIDDPRLRSYPPEVRKEIVKEVNGQPDSMITEHMAITCRVAPSFIRIGHLELFGRRYRVAKKNKTSDEQRCRDELRLLFEHAAFREFGGPEPSVAEASDLNTRVLDMLRIVSTRISALTAEWMRVGYCQGNFNSDNCLVAGRTMDYGPFGFIERYERYWNMWVGGGEKYSFRNQHTAGEMNFISLARALILLLDEAGQREVNEVFIPSYRKLASDAVNDVYRRKLGLQKWTEVEAALFAKIEDLMEASRADYTIFWRQLSTLPEAVLPPLMAIPVVNKDEFVKSLSEKTESIIFPFSNAFYEPLSESNRAKWIAALTDWLYLVHSHCNEASIHSAAVSRDMRLVSPKYVPREWMLIEAYRAAEQGNYAALTRLQQLFAHPYDEQADNEAAFYRRAPEESLDKGGVSCMT